MRVQSPDLQEERTSFQHSAPLSPAQQEGHAEQGLGLRLEPVWGKASQKEQRSLFSGGP